MKNIAILCNGCYPRKDYPRYLLDSADVLVCCDGAVVKHLKRLSSGQGRLPDIIVGDLDSIPSAVRKRFSDIIVHDSDQDTNDLTKAFKVVMERFCGDCDGTPDCGDVAIHIIGASGKREDHTLGNLSLLMEYERLYGLSARGIHVEAVSDWSTAFAVSHSCSFTPGAGRSVSFFCNDPALRIKSSGLQWPLDEVVFDNWWKGTLNRTCADTVSLEFSHPSPVLVILGD